MTQPVPLICTVCLKRGTNKRNMRAQCNRSRLVVESYMQGGHCNITEERTTT